MPITGGVFFAYCLNNPLIYIDPTGQKSWLGKFTSWVKKGWDEIWDASEQFAVWAQENYIPSVNIGMSYNHARELQPIGDINGVPLFNNEAQAEVSVQNAVNSINKARGDYFGQQNQNNAYEQQVNTSITKISHNSNVRSSIDEATYITGLIGLILETRKETYRIRTKKIKFSPKVYVSGWRGNGQFKVRSIKNIGKSTGNTVGWLAIGFDAAGMMINKYNPESNFAVTPLQGTVNIGVGLNSMYYNPIFGVVYTGYGIFYPGGFDAATEAHREAHEYLMELPYYNYFSNKQ